MLPNHEELIRAMTQRTTVEAERAARDRGHRRDLEEQARATGEPPRTAPIEADRRPCPPPCPERARGVAG